MSAIDDLIEHMECRLAELQNIPPTLLGRAIPDPLADGSQWTVIGRLDGDIEISRDHLDSEREIAFGNTRAAYEQTIQFQFPREPENPAARLLAALTRMYDSLAYLDLPPDPELDLESWGITPRRQQPWHVNPEDPVVDEIDALVRENLAAGPQDDYSRNRYDRCAECGCDWHGLECSRAGCDCINTEWLNPDERVDQ